MISLPDFPAMIKSPFSLMLLYLQNAVPKRLNEFQRIDPTANTKGFRQQAFVYVDKGKQSFRMSLQDIKNLNTKIVAATRTNEVNTSELSVDDYIFSED